ncbi:MAG: hypothetical protein RLN70_01385, partial [Rhodospirillaceae bacterium]
MGEGVRGFALASQLGDDFVILQRCTFAEGYSCRVEFHKIEEEHTSTFIIFTLTTLDPGTGPNDGDEFDENKDEEPAKKDPKSQDKRARNKDSRKRRKRRKRGKGKRSKRTSADNAKAKAAKKSKKADTGIADRFMGDPGTMESAIKMPTGACSMS